MRTFSLLLLILFSAHSVAAEKVVNVFCWTGYISSQMIQQFEKKTGITVNFTQYSSNEELYAKLKANPNIGYDVIVPSTYYVQRMNREHMLLKLDKQKLPHFKNLDRHFLYQSFDPKNDYSVPFYWGADIIAINKQYYHPESIHVWNDLWQPRFKNKLLILEDLRDIFGVALLTQGYSINTQNPQQIHQGYQKLQKLWPNVKVINSDAVQSLLADDDVTAAIAWSGDIYAASRMNPNVMGIYPKDGFVIWVDSFSIPKHAPHVNNAYTFIDYVLNAKHAAKLAEFAGFSTPNKAALAYLPTAMRNSPLLYPSAKTLSRGQFESYVAGADGLYKKYWQLFRLGA
tara:strand:+ start:15238 stop:16266 length:1029 start_codon:yes stop_codon:yes gene_type:complete